MRLRVHHTTYKRTHSPYYSRVCTLTVTRLEVMRPFESGHGSIVMAASMKTPHRHLRSNEFKLGSDGLLDIPLQVTFCLQVLADVYYTIDISMALHIGLIKG